MSPRRDGTGPDGKGPRTGRGLGWCGTGKRDDDNRPPQGGGQGRRRRNRGR